MSTATPELNKALAAFQTKLPKISKGEEGKVSGVSKSGKAYEYTYKYADLADISPVILPLLGEEGLSWMCRPTMLDGRFVLLYELRHSSGESVEGIYPLANAGGPQDVGKEITYAKRYTLCAVTGVAPGGDDDDGSSSQRATTKQLPPQAQRGKDRAQETVEQRLVRRRKRMFALFGDIGLKQRDEMLVFASDVVRHDLESSSDLTAEEVEHVIHALEAEQRTQQQEEPDGPMFVDPNTGEVSGDRDD